MCPMIQFNAMLKNKKREEGNHGIREQNLRSGDIVQRDLYSAFLLEHIDTESLQYNMETLNSAFPAFLEMHENTKRRLQAVGSSLPASIGF